MSPDKNHSHQRVETSRPGLMETIALVCRNKVGGNIRGLSAAAFLAAASVMGCQPAPGEDCKAKTCDVSNPDDSGTPNDVTTPTDNTDPTCPGDPDCPPIEVPDTTPPAAPQFGLGDEVTVGEMVPSVSVPITVSTDTAALDLQLNGGTWTPEDFKDGRVVVPAGATAKIRAKDAAGNISPEDSFRVNIDSQGPSVPFPASSTQEEVGPDAMSLPVTFTIPQPTETVKIMASINNGAFAEIPYDGSSEVTIDLAVGSNVRIKALDNHDVDEGISAAISVIREAVPAAAGVNENYFALNASAPTFPLDITLPENINYLEIEDELGNVAYSQSVTPPTLHLDLPNPGANKTYTLFVRTPKGTWSIGTDVNVEYDNVAPAAPVITSNNGTNWGVMQSNFTLEGTCDGSDTQKMQYKINNGIWQDIPGYVAGSNNWSLDQTIGSFEGRVYHVQAIDKAKNISQEDQIYTEGIF